MLLSYTLPAEPSSKRVLVWRHLRKIGAILDSGIWLLPCSPDLEEEFRRVVSEIAGLGGKPLAFLGEDFSPDQHEALKNAFNSERSTEYLALLQRCERFLAHVTRWTESQEFNFAALEELDEDLEKRRRTLSQITTRDVFGVPERGLLESSLGRCEAALAAFAEQVFNQTSKGA
jgi:hypothetical protein